MNDKDIAKLAGEIVVAMYEHGGAVPWGSEKIAALATQQARALARTLAKTDDELVGVLGPLQKPSKPAAVSPS